MTFQAGCFPGPKEDSLSRTAGFNIPPDSQDVKGYPTHYQGKRLGLGFGVKGLGVEGLRLGSSEFIA